MFHPDDDSEGFLVNVYKAVAESNPFFKGPLEDEFIVATVIYCLVFILFVWLFFFLHLRF